MSLLKRIYKQVKKPIEWIEIPLPRLKGKQDKEDQRRDEE